MYKTKYPISRCRYVAGKVESMENRLQEQHSIGASNQLDLPISRRSTYQQPFTAAPMLAEVNFLAPEEMKLCDGEVEADEAVMTADQISHDWIINEKPSLRLYSHRPTALEYLQR